MIKLVWACDPLWRLPVYIVVVGAPVFIIVRWSASFVVVVVVVLVSVESTALLILLYCLLRGLACSDSFATILVLVGLEGWLVSLLF